MDPSVITLAKDFGLPWALVLAMIGLFAKQLQWEREQRKQDGETLRDLLEASHDHTTAIASLEAWLRERLRGGVT